MLPTYNWRKSLDFSFHHGLTLQNCNIRKYKKRPNLPRHCSSLIDVFSDSNRNNNYANLYQTCLNVSDSLIKKKCFLNFKSSFDNFGFLIVF